MASDTIVNYSRQYDWFQAGTKTRVSKLISVCALISIYRKYAAGGPETIVLAPSSPSFRAI